MHDETPSRPSDSTIEELLDKLEASHVFIPEELGCGEEGCCSPMPAECGLCYSPGWPCEDVLTIRAAREALVKPKPLAYAVIDPEGNVLPKLGSSSRGRGIFKSLAGATDLATQYHMGGYAQPRIKSRIVTLVAGEVLWNGEEHQL